jgi:hypothetical protein
MRTHRGVARSLRWGLVVAAIASAGILGAAKPPKKTSATRALPELNRKVLEFARGQLGKKVGDGECSTLAREALQYAGARIFPWARSGDFIWGRPVASFAEALPGDIVQFRDTVFDGRAWISGDRWMSWHYEYPHHTAIVAAVHGGGAEVIVLHQNVHGGGSNKTPLKLVQQGTLWPESLQPGGRLWIYRPIGPDENPGEPAAAQPEPEPESSKPARPRR